MLFPKMPTLTRHEGFLVFFDVGPDQILDVVESPLDEGEGFVQVLGQLRGDGVQHKVDPGVDPNDVVEFLVGGNERKLG